MSSQNVNVKGGDDKFAEVSEDGHFSVEASFNRNYQFKMRLMKGIVSAIPYNIKCTAFKVQNTNAVFKVYRGSIFSPPYIDKDYVGDNRGVIIYPTTTDPVSLSNTNLCVLTSDGDNVEVMVDVYGNTNETIEDIFTSPEEYTPPTVTGHVPTAGATGVTVSEIVEITFSEEVDMDSIDDTTIVITPVVAATRTKDDDVPEKILLDPNADLAFATQYTITITSGIRDLQGHVKDSNTVFSFTTAAAPDTTAPTVVSRTPLNAATGVAIDVNGTITFNEALSPASVNNTNCRIIKTSDSSNQTATVTLSADKKTVTINPTANLLNSTGYTLRATTGVEDVALNNLAAESNSTFTTIAGDVTPPTITDVDPDNNSSTAAISANWVVIFSESMDPATLTAARFIFTKVSNGAAIPYALSISNSNKTVTLNPSSNLEYGTQYKVHVDGFSTGVKDVAGNALQSEPDFFFTTAAQSYTLIYNITQENGAWNRLEDMEKASGLKLNDTVTGSGSDWPLNTKIPRRVKVRMKRVGSPGGLVRVQVIKDMDETDVRTVVGTMNANDVDSTSDGGVHTFTNPSASYAMGNQDAIIVETDNGSDSAYIEVARTEADRWSHGFRVDFMRGVTNDSNGHEDTDIAMEVYQ